MPQPATHYLVVRRSIPEVYWEDWWNDTYKKYFGLGSLTPDLFYFPAMPKAIIGGDVRKDLSWDNIASPLHSERSYDMFCSLLDISKSAKLNATSEEERVDANKQLAFSFGYYTHVVTDCIFHPYVYRSTGDYWHTKDNMTEGKHKKQELYIDNELYTKYYPKEENLSRISYRCESQDGLLESVISCLFDEGLHKNYSDLYPMDDGINCADSSHPIQQAYLALVRTIPPLFEGKKVYLWSSHKSFDIKFSSLVSLFSDDFFTSEYPEISNLPKHTPEELFDFAVIECSKIFKCVLDFWNTESTDSKAFFTSNYTNFLNAGNYNLDTGLPSEFNNHADLRKDNSKNYRFGADILTNNYNIFENDLEENRE